MTNGSIPKDMPQDEIIKEYIEQKIQCKQWNTIRLHRK